MSEYTINANIIYYFYNYNGKNSFKNSSGVYTVNTYCTISLDYYGNFWFFKGRNSSSGDTKYYTALYVGGNVGYLYYDYGLDNNVCSISGWTNQITVKSTLNNQQFTTNDVFYGTGILSQKDGEGGTKLKSQHYTEAPTTGNKLYEDQWYFPTMNSDKSSYITGAFDSSQYWNNNTAGSYIGVDTLNGYAWCCPFHSSQSFQVSLIDKHPYLTTGVGVGKILFDDYGNYIYPSFSIGDNKLYSLFFETSDGEIRYPVDNNGTAPCIYTLDNSKTFKGITCVNDLIFMSISEPTSDGKTKYYIIVSKIFIVNNDTGLSFIISDTPLYYIYNYIDSDGNTYPFDYIGCLTYCSLYDTIHIYAFAQVSISSVINQVILKLDISDF